LISVVGAFMVCCTLGIIAVALPKPLPRDSAHTDAAGVAAHTGAADPTSTAATTTATTSAANHSTAAPTTGAPVPPPAPAYTQPQPLPVTTTESTPPPYDPPTQQPTYDGVKPGAFCGDHWAYGWTVDMVWMQCKTSATDSRFRWRAA
jgi:hypothetical protein